MPHSFHDTLDKSLDWRRAANEFNSVESYQNIGALAYDRRAYAVT